MTITPAHLGQTVTAPVLEPQCFGFTSVTPGIKEAFGDEALSIASLCFRAFIGNYWGNTPQQDQELNAEAIKAGQGRVMANYDIDGTEVWVIAYISTNPAMQSNPDYCNTCVLLPSEY